MIKSNKLFDLPILGKFIIAISFLFSAIFLIFSRFIYQVLEQYVIPDHNLTPNGERELTFTFLFGMVLLLGVGIYVMNAQDHLWRQTLSRVFLGEPLCSYARIVPTPKFVLIASSIIGLLLIGSMRLAGRFPPVFQLLYAKDHGILDLFVVVAIFVSAIILGIVVFKLWKEPRYGEPRLPLIIIYFMMVVLFIFYVGEEISWGQDFLRWETPELFSGNVEGQTNLHNYFNQYFDYGYIILSLVLLVVLFAVWLDFTRRLQPYNWLILPHPSLLGISLLIAFVSIVWFREQELLEELVAVFILFYSIRIFTSLSSENCCLFDR